MGAKNERKYFQIQLAEMKGARHQDGSACIDDFRFHLVARSKASNEDLSQIRGQLIIALSAFLRTQLQVPKHAKESVALEKIFERIRPLLLSLARGEKRKPGRKQVRVDRIINAFSQSQSELVSLDALASEFGGTSDPQKAATSTIGWLNKVFKKQSIEYEIVRVSYYKFQRREIKEQS
jgi:hypothetical protein